MRRKTIGIIILIVCFIMNTAFVSPRDTMGNVGKTVRVAFPEQDGLTMMDEKGNYSGYTYEYLMEISKYTGWRYEFVTMEGDTNTQAMDALGLLQEGEVDLLGGLNYNEGLAEMFTYPGYSYGTNYLGIYVPNESPLSESSLYTLRSIRVGVYQRALKENDKLEQFGIMNNISIEQKVVDSLEKLMEMVKNKEVDAVLSTDLALNEHINMRMIVRFSPTPFYLAASKGSVDLVRQLDYAISTINTVDPDFSVKLFQKYFSPDSVGFFLTDDEKNYVRKAPKLQVVLYDNKPPFGYQDEKGQLVGIHTEVFREISKVTGLQFQFCTVSTYEEYRELIQSGEIDIAADILLNNQDAIDANSMLSVPWHNLSLYTAYREETEGKGEPVFAVPYYLKNAVKSGKAVKFYDTTEECLQAVMRGDVQAAYLGGLSGQYYMNSQMYRELKFQALPESMNQQLSIGIVNQEDFYLLAIMNKWISHFSSEKLDEIVYRNTFQMPQIPISVWIRNNIGAITIGTMVGVILILGGYILRKNRMQKRIALENERYNILSNLINEFFYEYNLEKDELSLPKKCADYFSCDIKIKAFSQRLKALEQTKRYGIWQLGEAILEGAEGYADVSCRMEDQSVQWFRVICSPVFSQNRRVYTIGKIANIQDSKEEQLQLERKAQIDGLTGVFNIRSFQDTVKQRLEQLGGNSSYAFAVLDIDNFKQINDSYGHYKGDILLIRLAEKMSEIFRPAMIGRLGGDEFVIFAENPSRTELMQNCEKLGQVIAEEMQMVLGEEVTLSIGITLTKENTSYDNLYQQADQALYERKFQGKKGHTFFQDIEENTQ